MTGVLPRFTIDIHEAPDGQTYDIATWAPGKPADVALLSDEKGLKAPQVADLIQASPKNATLRIFSGSERPAQYPGALGLEMKKRDQRLSWADEPCETCKDSGSVGGSACPDCQSPTPTE